MADNVVLPGTGEVVAADEVGGAKYQRVKLAVGADNSAADAPGDATDGFKVQAKLLAGTAEIGKLAAGTAEIGKLAAGTAEIGKLAAGTAVIGSTKRQESGRTMFHAKVALSASQTAATILDPTGGKKFVLKKMIVVAKTAGDVYFFDSTDDSAHAIGPALTLVIGGGWTETWDSDDPYRSAAADNILKYTSGAGLTGSVYLDYFEE